MTTQEKLLEAAEEALDGYALITLHHRDLYAEEARLSELMIGEWWPDVNCLYLCFLAAAWDDL